MKQGAPKVFLQCKDNHQTMIYTVTTEFVTFDKKGNSKNYPVGTKVNSKVYNILGAARQAKCKLSSTRIDYTLSEALAIGDLYLQNDNLQWVVDTYTKLYPTQPHSVDSIHAMVRQFMALDSEHPYDTQWVAKTVTIKAAQHLAPERFFASNEEAREYKLQLQAEDILKDLIG